MGAKQAMPAGTRQTTRSERGNKIPPQVVPKGDCNTSLTEGRMFAEGIEGVIAMADKDHECCPKLYECSRIRMAPMIRALLRCTAEEAMKSICANCDERPEVSAVRKEIKGDIRQEEPLFTAQDPPGSSDCP